MKVINNQVIVKAYVETNVLIPEGSRACSSHFNDSNKLDSNALEAVLSYKDSIMLKKESIKNMFENLRYFSRKSNIRSRFEYIDNVSNVTCQTFIDFSREDFIYHKTSQRNFFFYLTQKYYYLIYFKNYYQNKLKFRSIFCLKSLKTA
jgi:hypothetical protein